MNITVILPFSQNILFLCKSRQDSGLVAYSVVANSLLACRIGRVANEGCERKSLLGPLHPPVLSFLPHVGFDWPVCLRKLRNVGLVKETEV